MHPTEAIHGDLGIHQTNDPVIYLSNSGSTPELLFLEPVLRNRGAKIIGILGNLKSPLAEKVDCALDASVDKESDPLGIVPTASFIVSSAICDALATSLMKRKGLRKMITPYTSRGSIWEKFNFESKGCHASSR